MVRLNPILKMLSPFALFKLLEKNDATRAGKKTAEEIDRWLDNAFGNKKSAQISERVIPWIQEYLLALIKELKKLGG